MTDQTSNLIFKGWSFNVFFITFEIKSHTLRKKSTWLEIPSFFWNIPKWMEKLNSPFSLGGLGWWAPGYWRSHQTHSDISGLSSDAPRPKITWNFWTHDLRLHRVSPAQGLDLGVGWRMGEWSPWSEKWGMVYVFTRWKHESILHSMPTISNTEWEQRKNIDICCKLKQHHCKFDAILKCYNLLMDTTSWMLAKDLGCFLKCGMPCTSRSQVSWTNTLKTMKVVEWVQHFKKLPYFNLSTLQGMDSHTPPRVQGKSSTQSCL